VPDLNNLAEGSYTISAWFQPDELPPGRDAQNNAAYGIAIRSGWHHGLAYNYEGSFCLIQYFVKPDDASRPFNVSTGTKAFPAAVFHHLASGIDRDAGRIFIYVDGNLEATEPIKPPQVRAWPYTVPWRLGIAGPDSDGYRWCAKGVIDDVRFYNRALTPADVQTLYRAPAAAAPMIKASGPWRPLFDGQNTNCLMGTSKNDWQVLDGCLANKPGVDNAAQLTTEFADGELRLRLESRGNYVCWFHIRQSSTNGFRLDLKQLGDQMNQNEHEIVFTMRGPSVTATIDGKPAKVDLLGPSTKGLLQFNCSTTGALKIRSIEYRP
jgi:hypothetical protein